ncbi:hypothetical protein BLOT_007223 [Blomia tropicalis]|nr:hypothetical protein BLOT_007223 [Blomia tropicalis]
MESKRQLEEENIFQPENKRHSRALDDNESKKLDSLLEQASSETPWKKSNVLLFLSKYLLPVFDDAMSFQVTTPDYFEQFQKTFVTQKSIKKAIAVGKCNSNIPLMVALFSSLYAHNYSDPERLKLFIGEPTAINKIYSFMETYVQKYVDSPKDYCSEFCISLYVMYRIVVDGFPCQEKMSQFLVLLDHFITLPIYPSHTKFLVASIFKKLKLIKGENEKCSEEKIWEEKYSKLNSQFEALIFKNFAFGTFSGYTFVQMNSSVHELTRPTDHSGWYYFEVALHTYGTIYVGFLAEKAFIDDTTAKEEYSQNYSDMNNSMNRIMVVPHSFFQPHEKIIRSLPFQGETTRQDFYKCAPTIKQGTRIGVLLNLSDPKSEIWYYVDGCLIRLPKEKRNSKSKSNLFLIDDLHKLRSHVYITLALSAFQQVQVMVTKDQWTNMPTKTPDSDFPLTIDQLNEFYVGPLPQSAMRNRPCMKKILRSRVVKIPTMEILYENFNEKMNARETIDNENSVQKLEVKFSQVWHMKYEKNDFSVKSFYAKLVYDLYEILNQKPDSFNYATVEERFGDKLDKQLDSSQESVREFWTLITLSFVENLGLQHANVDEWKFHNYESVAMWLTWELANRIVLHEFKPNAIRLNLPHPYNMLLLCSYLARSFLVNYIYEFIDRPDTIKSQSQNCNDFEPIHDPAVVFALFSLNQIIFRSGINLNLEKYKQIQRLVYFLQLKSSRINVSIIRFATLIYKKLSIVIRILETKSLQQTTSEDLNSQTITWKSWTHTNAKNNLSHSNWVFGTFPGWTTYQIVTPINQLVNGQGKYYWEVVLHTVGSIKIGVTDESLVNKKPFNYCQLNASTIGESGNFAIAYNPYEMDYTRKQSKRSYNMFIENAPKIVPGSVIGCLIEINRSNKPHPITWLVDGVPVPISGPEVVNEPNP